MTSWLVTLTATRQAPTRTPGGAGTIRLVERIITVAWWTCMLGLAVNVVVGVALMLTGHPGAFVPSVLIGLTFGSVAYMLGSDPRSRRR